MFSEKIHQYKPATAMQKMLDFSYDLWARNLKRLFISELSYTF